MPSLLSGRLDVLQSPLLVYSAPLSSGQLEDTNVTCMASTLSALRQLLVVLVSYWARTHGIGSALRLSNTANKHAPNCRPDRLRELAFSVERSAAVGTGAIQTRPQITPTISFR